MAAPTPLSYLTPEQRKGLEGKKVLVISHSKWNPNGLPGMWRALESFALLTGAAKRAL